MFVHKTIADLISSIAAGVMPSSDVQRKLTSILCCDVAGYSRMMGDNPEDTLHTLTEYREVFSKKIGAYQGRVVNTPGDAILAEFGSVLDTISCAVEIQQELAERNGKLPKNRRMDFRIGINLGDVLVKQGDIFGDGVNVAARLESLAKPGGICISGKTHQEVKNRLPLYYEFMGERKVKNIVEPIEAYHVLTDPDDIARQVARSEGQREAASNLGFKAAVGFVAAILVAGGGWFVWDAMRQPRQGAIPREARSAAPMRKYIRRCV